MRAVRSYRSRGHREVARLRVGPPAPAALVGVHRLVGGLEQIRQRRCVARLPGREAHARAQRVVARPAGIVRCERRVDPIRTTVTWTASVFVSSSTNSSPPSRHTRSEARQLSVSSTAISTSASSPTSWPCVSLISLKPSRSSAATTNGVRVRSASASCCRAASAKPRRLSRPVSASRAACALSRSCAAWSCACATSSACVVARSSISAIAAVARSSSVDTCSGVHCVGATSMAQSAPSVSPSAVRSGTPAYAMSPSSRNARLSITSGCVDASCTSSTRSDATTCWQNE